MIIWITGLPCIGKTSSIRKAICNNNKWYLLRMDQLRDKALSRCAENYYQINNKEINICRYQDLYKSINTYLEYNKIVANILLMKYDKYFNHMSNSGKYIIEISPFILASWNRPEKIIYSYVSSSIYKDNIKRRYNVEEDNAESWVNFYIRAFDNIYSKLSYYKILEIDKEEMVGLKKILDRDLS